MAKPRQNSEDIILDLFFSIPFTTNHFPNHYNPNIEYFSNLSTSISRIMIQYVPYNHLKMFRKKLHICFPSYAQKWFSLFRIKLSIVSKNLPGLLHCTARFETISWETALLRVILVWNALRVLLSLHILPPKNPIFNRLFPLYVWVIGGDITQCTFSW